MARLRIVQMSLLPNFTDGFTAIPTNNPAGDFAEIGKLARKLIWRHKTPEVKTFTLTQRRASIHPEPSIPSRDKEMETLTAGRERQEQSYPPLGPRK